MSDRLERAMSMLLTAAAVVMAAAIGLQAFAPASVRQPGVVLTLDSIPFWRDALPIGIKEGPIAAPVTIVEMADLECPACRDFQSTLADIRKRYPKKVAIVFVNYPLAQHRFAIGAARAGECAARVGAFDRWRDEVYKQQDSLGLKSWGSFAAAAGISDTAAIATCARDPTPVPLIQAGLKFGTRINLSGTPTIIVNGWRFSNTPSSDQLRNAIDAELDGRRPVGALTDRDPGSAAR
ncbi:MAG: thioredoxin domain-containing protein [Gemmatimonadaceae bacterium]